MKVISYILSLYLVVLSFIPCCNFDDCPVDKTELEGSHSSDDNDCGTCSPFFNCEGCATVSINAEAVSFTIIILSATIEYSDFILPVTGTVHSEFWQPPRLG